MALRYYFRLIGVTTEAERDLKFDPTRHSVGEVKQLLKKRYNLAPFLEVKILHDGKALTEDEIPWSRVVGDPPKRPITIMAVNPHR
ncbi:MAG: hypothetical protein ACTSU5_10660 [Promethearchaeota archaeon]